MNNNLNAHNVVCPERKNSQYDIINAILCRRDATRHQS